MAILNVRYLVACTLASAALIGLSPLTSQAQFQVQNQQRLGIGINIGNNGFDNRGFDNRGFGNNNFGNNNFGNNGFGNNGFGNNGFDNRAFQARDLANDIRFLSQRGFIDVAQNRIPLNRRDQGEILELLRFINGQSTELLFVLQGNRNFNARGIVRQLEQATDDLQNRARFLGSRELDNLARQLEQLGDQLQNVLN